MNTENSKTNKSDNFFYEFTDKLNLKHPNKNIALANLSIYYTWKNVKSAYNNNKFKIFAPTWNHEFDLPDGSYSISDIQIILSILSNIKNRIVFKIKAGYKLELLFSATNILLGSAKRDADQDKDGEDVPKLASVEVVLIHCILVDNNYQQVSKVLFTFAPDIWSINNYCASFINHIKNC